jgi:hypothetical protein
MLYTVHIYIYILYVIYTYMLYVMIYIYIHMNIHYCKVVSLFVLVVCNQTFDCWEKKHIGKSCASSHCTYDSQLDHQFCWQKSCIC